MTLNIRRDRGDDGINNWEHRRDLVAALLRRHQPDVIGFQEVLMHQLRDLESMLPGYEWSGVARDDGREAGEFAPVFHRGLVPRRQGTFWFSDTPDVPSRTWPGMTRICTWVEFGDDDPFAVFNVHLEYEFESTQMKSVELLRRRMTSYPPDFPLLLAGDFNFNPGTPSYHALSEFVRDSYAPRTRSNGGAAGPGTPAAPPDTTVRNPATCHDFTGRTQALETGAGRIDYIWHRGTVQVSDFRIVTDGSDVPSGVFLSDHWPVICRVAVG
jgi:endonuclease/exonuclease/phosphatase family metal-dependent hydrolase